jgi:hypothetical protein
MGKNFGFLFSLNRALGISGMKNKISRSIGIPLTKSGRNQKFGRTLATALFNIPATNRGGNMRITKAMTDKIEKYEFIVMMNDRVFKAMWLIFIYNGYLYLTKDNISLTKDSYGKVNFIVGGIENEESVGQSLM